MVTSSGKIVMAMAPQSGGDWYQVVTDPVILGAVDRYELNSGNVLNGTATTRESIAIGYGTASTFESVSIGSQSSTTHPAPLSSARRRPAR